MTRVMLNKKQISINKTNWEKSASISTLLSDYRAGYARPDRPVDMNNADAVQNRLDSLVYDGFNLRMVGQVDISHEFFDRAIELANHLLQLGRYKPVWDRSVCEPTAEQLRIEQVYGESMVRRDRELTIWMRFGRRDVQELREQANLRRDLYENDRKRYGISAFKDMLLTCVEAGLHQEAVALHESDRQLFRERDTKFDPNSPELRADQQPSSGREEYGLYRIARYGAGLTTDKSSIADEIEHWCDKYRDWKHMTFPPYGDRLAWAWIRATLVTGDTELANILTYVRGY